MYHTIRREAADGLSYIDYDFIVDAGHTPGRIRVRCSDITRRVRGSKRHRKWIVDWVYRPQWTRGSQTTWRQIFDNPGIPDDVREELHAELVERLLYDF